MANQDIIQALDGLKLQVQEELGAVREYRALLNIRTAISELAGIEELTNQLGQIADQLELRLKDMREFQALQSVEKSIGDMSTVLDLLREAARKKAATPKDILAGVKSTPGAAAKPEARGQAQTQPVAAQPSSPPAAEAVPDEPPPLPSGDIEADIANVLRVGDRLRIKN